MSFEQILRLSQTLQLSPTLLQSMQILQMNTLELADYLNTLALENPALEYTDTSEQQTSWEEFTNKVSWLTGSYTEKSDNGFSWDHGTTPDQTESLDLFLRDQLSRLPLSPSLQVLCQFLSNNLDDKGRLDPDDLTGLLRAGVPEELLEEAVETLQSLDPPGIAARNLAECLTLQLRRLPGDHTLAIQLCSHLDALAKERYKALAAQLSSTETQIKEAAQLIQTLNPDPVTDLTPPEPVQYVRPDAWVAEVDGQLQVFVNQWDLPRFTLSHDYLQMVKTGQEEEATEYLQQKISQAQWVLQCVQRRQATLTNCLTALVQAQKDFFSGRSETPGPLLRRELADQLEVHPSTVTRTLGHKYIQCRQGLFPTSYFFSRRTGGDHSEQALKAMIARLIKNEDPHHPLSDQDIVDILRSKGINLARRTAAKYRQALKLPPSYQRRRN